MVDENDNLPKRRYDHSDVPSWVDERELVFDRIHVHNRVGEESEYSYSIYQFTIEEHDNPESWVSSDTTVDLDRVL